jgi:general secretion pathway protein C
MLARLSAFVIWAVVAGAAMFWGLRLLVWPPPSPPNVVAVSEAGGVRGDLSRLLGAEAAPAAAAVAPESSRFRLLGVMAGKAVGDGRTPGVALISIDGKPPRTFGAGARIDSELTLQSLGLRTASIGPAQGPAAFVLEIPPLPAAATGTLAPPGAMSASPAAAPAAPSVVQQGPATGLPRGARGGGPRPESMR